MALEIGHFSKCKNYFILDPLLGSNLHPNKGGK